MPATLTAPVGLTAEEYFDTEDGDASELVRGEVVSMSPPGFLHGLVQGNVYYECRKAADRAGSGRVTVESGVITETGPDTVRGPDVAYWSFARLPADRTPVVFADVAPDFVAEVVSPGNSRRHIAIKVREYFATGAALVWIVDPEDRTVTAYRGPGGGSVAWDHETVSAHDVLPGFVCRVAEFFPSAPPRA